MNTASILIQKNAEFINYFENKANTAWLSSTYKQMKKLVIGLEKSEVSISDFLTETIETLKMEYNGAVVLLNKKIESFDTQGAFNQINHLHIVNFLIRIYEYLLNESASKEYVISEVTKAFKFFEKYMSDFNLKNINEDLKNI